MSINTVLYFSILFFLSELILMITKRSKKRKIKLQDDKKSLTLFWFTIPASFTIGFFTANYREWNTFNYSIAILGLGAFTLGIIIRWISIIQLNKWFTVDVAITENHNLKTDGIYKKVRHPGYLGLLLICTGLSIAMNSIVSLLVVSVPIYLAVIYRIKVEERILINEFGERYKQYMSKTHRLLPI